MIWDLCLEVEMTEPAVGEILMNFLTKAPLRPDPEIVADD